MKVFIWNHKVTVLGSSARLTVALADDCEDGLSVMPKPLKVDHPEECVQARGCTAFGAHRVAVVISRRNRGPRKLARVITHESVHAARHLLSHYELSNKDGKDDEEALAYLTDWIFDMCWGDLVAPLLAKKGKRK